MPDVHIRINEAVKAELNVNAKALGMSPGTYARTLIIKGLKTEAARSPRGSK